MRSLFGLLAIALLSVGVNACGGSDRNTSSAKSTDSRITTTTVSNAISSRSSSGKDADGDSDNNDDDYAYGHAASAADGRAVKALVKRYYEAAAANDGAKACSLIYSLLAEEIPELYGEPPGPPALRGKTCSLVMSKFFRQHHGQLIADTNTLKITNVRIKGNRALTLLSFKAMPRRDILVHREGRTWKVDELLDTGLG